MDEMKTQLPLPFGNRRFSWALTMLYVVSLALLAWCLYRGAGFYATPHALRIHAGDYRLWRSAGFWGHAFGIAGSAMMIFMLFYSVRKRWRRIQNWGRLSNWLQVHIYFGIIGPLLVILHSAFKVQGLVAVSFWSMIAVAWSGVLGRYLYLQIPHNFFGEELNHQQAQAERESFARQLQETHGLDLSTQNEVQKLLMPVIDPGWRSLRIIVKLMAHDLRRPSRLHRVETLLRDRLSLDDFQRHEVLRLVGAQSRLDERLLLWNHLHSIFHYWHVIHRPFAYIMYLFMLVHIGVAIWLGYNWIL
jgi:hypothetical protein